MDELIEEYNLDELVVKFLDIKLGSEQYKFIIDILKTFSKFDYFSYEKDITDLISISDSVDLVEYPNLVYKIVIEHLKYILNTIGILVVDQNDFEITEYMKFLNNILKGITKFSDIPIEEYDDMLITLNNSTDPNLVLKDLLITYGNIKEEDIEIIIDDVQPKLITILTNVLLDNMNNLSTDDIDTEEIEKQFRIINILIKIINNYIPIGAYILAKEPNLDIDIELLIKNNIDKLNKDINKASLDILSLIVISNKSKDDYLTIYNDYFEDLVEDTIYDKFKYNLNRYKELMNETD